MVIVGSTDDTSVVSTDDTSVGSTDDTSATVPSCAVQRQPKGADARPDYGFRVRGLGFRVLGFRVEGLGVRV